MEDEREDAGGGADEGALAVTDREDAATDSRAEGRADEGGADDDARQDEGGQRDEQGRFQKGENRENARVRDLIDKHKASEARLQHAMAEIERLKKPVEQREAEEKDKAWAKDFWKDPPGRIRGELSELRTEIKQIIGQQQDAVRYEGDLHTLKGAPGWSDELGQAMVKALERHGLDSRDAQYAFGGRSKALRAAYEWATGKEWGHWASDGYNTRKTKERLSRPGSGGGSGRGAQQLSPEDYERRMTDLANRNLTEDEQSREIQKLNAGLDAFYAAQQE